MKTPLRHSGNPERIGKRRMVAGLSCAAAVGVIAFLYGATVEAVELAVFACVLIQGSLVDLESRTIPDSYLAIAAIARLAYLLFAWHGGMADAADIGFYAMSALAVGVVLVLVVMAADSLFGNESMGGGDVKLYMVAAWYFGWEKALVVILLSCVFGVVSAALSGRGRNDREDGTGFMKRTLPFGPAIAIACLVVMVAGGVPSF